MMNTFEHNRNILKSINTFNLLEKTRYEAPKDIKQTTFSNPLPKQKYHKIIDNKKWQQKKLVDRRKTDAIALEGDLVLKNLVVNL